MTSEPTEEGAAAGNAARIVAHRGCSGHAPENTLAAFQMAADDARISWIELDVQQSKDGVPVVIHDFKLKRTTGASGAVKDYTYKELSALDNGVWFAERFRGERIPTLESVLLRFGGRFTFNIEIKTAPGLYAGLERSVASLLAQLGLTGNAVVTSFDYKSLVRTKLADPNLSTGLISGGWPVMLGEQLQSSGASFVSLEHSHITAALAAVWIERDIGMMAWTVNSTADIRRALALHPRLLVCTNYPERAFAGL